ncbi:hypothetical protein Hamer_G025006 [Homarus americanus]|uniref:Uncharacterized protein n=1 Tax=Homarus americanus TaxID=6706 RepID=A0A8J5TE81_HOMAM|nr:hypothetical protein Hamer_G025006 [Homarus americanus]
MGFSQSKMVWASRDSLSQEVGVTFGTWGGIVMAASVAKKLKYNDGYINYGCTSILADGIEKPQCVVFKSAGERLHED